MRAEKAILTRKTPTDQIVDTIITEKMRNQTDLNE